MVVVAIRKIATEKTMSGIATMRIREGTNATRIAANGSAGSRYRGPGVHPPNGLSAPLLYVRNAAQMVTANRIS